MFFVFDPEYFKVVGLIAVYPGSIFGSFDIDFSNFFGIFGVDMVISESNQLILLLERLIFEVDQLMRAEFAVSH